MAPRYAKAAPMIAPVFSWTGCYVGIHAGGGAMLDTYNGTHGDGGIAGGQVGCNYQTGMLVLGAEAEGYWSGMKTNYNTLTNASEGGTYNSDVRNKYDFTIAARMGVAFERALVYGKAGWVWGKFDILETQTNGCLSQTLDRICGPFVTQSANFNMNGLLIGLGLEYAITNNVTTKFEYNYLNYSTTHPSFTACNEIVCIPTGTANVSADKHIFKVGLNYLFNTPTAVVAKY
jgi:outer membrane immunogenic protein